LTCTRALAGALTPPAPLQATVKVAVPLELGVKLAVPLALLEPFQAPLLVQLVAFVEDQSRVTLCPSVMVPGVALIVAVGVGAALTCTRALAGALTPPAPLQATVKVAVPLELGVKLTIPLALLERLQAPLLVQLVAFVEDQSTVTLCPSVMVPGVALIVAVGAGATAVTVAAVVADPFGPLQVSVKELAPNAVGVTASAPLVALAPLHAPLAAQVVSPVEDHVSVAACPSVKVTGLADSVTPGPSKDAVKIEPISSFPPSLLCPKKVPAAS